MKLVLWSLDFPVMYVSGWIYFPDKRQTNFGHIFLRGADFCVSALSFSVSALFCFIARFCFQAVMFAYCFFSGLNSCPGRTPNELRTNFGLKFFFGAFCFGFLLNFLGFGRTKTLELQLGDAFFVQF